jgi:hypothetical protein
MGSSSEAGADSIVCVAFGVDSTPEPAVDTVVDGAALGLLAKKFRLGRDSDSSLPLDPKSLSLAELSLNGELLLRNLSA